MRLSRTAFALLAALSVLSAAVAGGHRFFYCPQMHQASLDPMCEPPTHDARMDGPAIDDADCCAARHFEKLATATLAPQETLLRSPLVAVLAAPTTSALPTMRAALRFSRAPRAGPGDPSSRDHRRRSMVSLT